MFKIPIQIINNYYWIVVLQGLTLMLGFRDWYSIVILLIVFVSILSCKTIKWCHFDFLIIIWIFYSVISLLWSEDYSLAYYGIKAEVIPILFYFIAKGCYCGDNQFLDNMHVPVLFAFVSAIILFVYSPDWYDVYKTQSIADDISEHSYYERTRLSGFWGHSYTIGYTSLIYLMYIIKLKFIDNKEISFFVIKLIIAMICIFLAQQRVTIYFLVLYVFIVMCYNLFSKGVTVRDMQFFFSIILALICLIVLLSKYIDYGYYEYIKERQMTTENNIIEDRFRMFQPYIKDISFWGSGIGSVGHYAFFIQGKDTIADCDYIRIPVEYGVVGSVIIFSIITYSLLIGIRNIKKNWFNVSCLLFLLISMFGAAPLELKSLNPFIYWYCMGKIHKI